MGGKALASSGVAVGGGVVASATTGPPSPTMSTEEDDDEDDGGFKPKSNGNLGYRPNPGLTEQSSLALNKMSGSKYSMNSNHMSPNHQLPILNLNQEPGTTNSTNTNVTLSSTTNLSNRLVNEQPDRRFKNLNDYTTSAHEFLTQSISQNALNHIDSSNESTKNMNSPSN